MFDQIIFVIGVAACPASIMAAVCWLTHADDCTPVGSRYARHK